MRNGRNLNLGWKFRQGFCPEDVTKPGEEGYEVVNLPHTVQEIPYDCFDQTETAMVSTYVKYFDLEKTEGKRVLVAFEGVSAYYDLYINGEKAGGHKGAYSMALFDITAYVHEGENRMLLMVDSHEREDIPPNGSTVDYLIYGGIYRDVTLYIQEETYLRQVLVRYSLENEKEDAEESVNVSPELLITNCGAPRELTVKMTLTGPEKEVWEDFWQIHVPRGESKILLDAKEMKGVHRWILEDPALYQVTAELYDTGEPGAAGAEAEEQAAEAEMQTAGAERRKQECVDSFVTRVGFRTVRVDADGFYLNGQKVKLIGLNRHQSYPYVGYAMGKRAQQKDAELLKTFMGLNMVRCSHYMQSRYFLDRCDELGLMVFEEIPGWGFIGGEEFRKVVFQDLRNMVLGHYNHPAIVIWGTRLNETTDCDELYEQTSRLCRKMDPDRPTTGVRWDLGSRLLEDIYSYNDYTEDDKGEFMLLTRGQVTRSSRKVPYLISEHTGAVLPTKPTDSEERQEAFAMRHARVLAKVQSSDEYLGALGWCMFDYNTHNDHNSMNKVCSHGVLDMFRVPKWAAYLYASQKSSEEQVILEPCSMVGRGERCEPVPFMVLTNCDYIEVTLSSDETRTYYPSFKFIGLKHPPIEVSENGEFWQRRWQGAKIVGYIDGKAAAQKIYSDNPRLSAIHLEADDSSLYNDRVEETRIVAYFEDENGNRMYGHQGVALVSVEGDLELIGPDILPVMGGAVAFWVKTKANGREGTAAVTVRSQRKDLGAVCQEIRMMV